MNKRIFVALSVGVVMTTAVAGCGTPRNGNYLYDSPNSTIFIQFTNSKGQIAGNLYESFESSDAQLTTNNSPITGQISGGEHRGSRRGITTF